MLHDTLDLEFQAMSVAEVFDHFRRDEEEITRRRRIYDAKATAVSCTDGLRLQQAEDLVEGLGGSVPFEINLSFVEGVTNRKSAAQVMASERELRAKAERLKRGFGRTAVDCP